MKYGIVIGRFNPPHLGHFYLIESAIAKSDYVIVVNGSYKAAHSPKKLLNEKEIQKIILASVSAPEKIIFVNVRDNLYDDQEWVLDVRKQIKWVALQSVIPTENTYTIFGYSKDQTSQYLKWFPLYKSVEVEPFHYTANGLSELIHATDLRDVMYQAWSVCKTEYNSNSIQFETMVKDYLIRRMGIKAFNAMFEDFDYDRLDWITEEYEHYENYKKMWSVAPYPPIFVTCDSVVFSNGCVLVIRRKESPGRGCYALPGGFLNHNEKVRDGILRELNEETKIRIPPGKLVGSLKAIEVFDAPGRSQRGRTITHAGLFILDEQTLPAVQGCDDAEAAHWIPLENLKSMEDKFFEDHIHIIRSMLKFAKI